MEKQENRHILPVLVPSAIVVLEVLIFNIPKVHELLQTVRWYKVGTIVPYHLIGGGILLVFTLMLTHNMVHQRSGKNLLHIMLAFLFASLMFLWSGIIDSVYYRTFYPTPDDRTRLIHDSIWFALLALFIVFFYLYLEFQEGDYPPLWRVMLVVGGTSPAFFSGLISLSDGINYINDRTYNSLLLRSLIMIFGMSFTSVFGSISMYKSLKNLENVRLRSASQLQFGTMVGLALSIIIFAVVNALANPIYINFPILLITFLAPLIFLYSKNPNYISTLATPLYEIIIVDNHGITVYALNFQTGEKGEKSNLSYLKGGVLSAVGTIFQEVTGTNGQIDTVKLEDRTLIVDTFRHLNNTYVSALICLESNGYIRNSLRILSSEIEKLLGDKTTSILDRLSAFPPEVDNLVRDIFY